MSCKRCCSIRSWLLGLSGRPGSPTGSGTAGCRELLDLAMQHIGHITFPCTAGGIYYPYSPPVRASDWIK
ncbi:MAG: hypothetical protein GX491_05400 [Chloroflexi bacterium]|nr:hypothetical protein [Chloroflexota bacterium]